MNTPSVVEYDLSPSTGSRMIISASNDRLSLTFIPPATGRVTLANSTVLGDGKGMALNAGQSPITLDIVEHGTVIRNNWYALYTAGSAPVSWIQTFP